MKEIVIILVILIIIFGGTFYIQRFLDNTSDSLVSKLENLKTEIEENIDNNRIKKESDEIYLEWGQINEGWSMIVLHDEIDLIEKSLIKVKSKITTNRIKESIEDLDTSIFLLKHIKEKEKTKLKNIF